VRAGGPRAQRGRGRGGADVPGEGGGQGRGQGGRRMQKRAEAAVSGACAGTGTSAARRSHASCRGTPADGEHLRRRGCRAAPRAASARRRCANPPVCAVRRPRQEARALHFAAWAHQGGSGRCAQCARAHARRASGTASPSGAVRAVRQLLCAPRAYTARRCVGSASARRVRVRVRSGSGRRTRQGVRERGRRARSSARAPHHPTSRRRSATGHQRKRNATHATQTQLGPDEDVRRGTPASSGPAAGRALRARWL